MTDLTTSYLGLALRNPLVASASPLSQGVDRVRALAGSGVGAVVLYSLFEEQVYHDQLRDLMVTESHENSFNEAQTWFPSAVPTTSQPVGSAPYLRLLEQASGSVDVPVIGSLNGSSPGGWAGFARSMQDAGAAAIELNIYFVPGDPHTRGRDVEDRHVEILQQVKDVVSVPVAVKLSPHFSSMGEMAMRLDQAGADGLVLFNRFLQPDVDPETMTVTTGVGLSSRDEARLPRTWIAILRGHVTASLAATSGVENAGDVAAFLLAGADVVMTASALLRHGLAHTGVLLTGLEDWMRRHAMATPDEFRGRLAIPVGVDQTAYERAGYVAALEKAQHSYGDRNSVTRV